MRRESDRADVRQLFAEARALAGGRPGGALRLMLMRLRQNRAEDAGVRSTVGRILSLEDGATNGRPVTMAQLLRRRGYRPLRSNGHVWVNDGRAGEAGAPEPHR